MTPRYDVFGRPIWHVTDEGLANRLTVAGLGLIPTFLSIHDPRTAAEQIDENYAHGGGWRPTDRATFALRGPDYALISVGDPPLIPWAITTLRCERLFYYDYSWVSIVQQDLSFQVSRLD